MSKKHHVKRSCLGENISENNDVDKKELTKVKSHHKKHHKRHHKKHSNKLYEEYIVEKLKNDTVLKDKNSEFCEKPHKACIEKEYSNYDEDHLEDCSENHYEDYSEDHCEDCSENHCEDYSEDHCEDCSENHCEDYSEDHCDIEDCNKTCSAISETKTLSLCPNTPQTIAGTTSSVVIKTPVVLAEPRIEISAESVFKLENPALEIKRIRKNVYLEQCEVIQDSYDPNFGTLFIVGFIRKNIEYATRDCLDKGITSGKVKHTTVRIPFTCATRVKFTTLPIFRVTPQPVQVEILQNNISICNPCEEGISGHLPCQLNLRLTEFFNEKIFCELVSAEIIESDFLENPTKEDCECILDKTYKNVREKVVVYLTIKLLQNQQVTVNRATAP